MNETEMSRGKREHEKNTSTKHTVNSSIMKFTLSHTPLAVKASFLSLLFHYTLFIGLFVADAFGISRKLSVSLTDDSNQHETQRHRPNRTPYLEFESTECKKRKQV